MARAVETAEQILARDAALLARANTLRFFPLVAERAGGCRVVDVEGRHYLDLVAGWCVANTGYGHPAVTRAVAETFARLSFAATSTLSHREVVALAERLVQLAPGVGPKKVSFGLSGSDANDGLAKLVPLATGRPRMVAFMGGMHGMVSGSAALSAIPGLARFGGGVGV